jgi:hypothetical protein
MLFRFLPVLDAVMHETQRRVDLRVGELSEVVIPGADRPERLRHGQRHNLVRVRAGVLERIPRTDRRRDDETTGRRTAMPQPAERRPNRHPGRDAVVHHDHLAIGQRRERSARAVTVDPAANLLADPLDTEIVVLRSRP